jgi:hypothetical protein
LSFEDFLKAVFRRFEVAGGESLHGSVENSGRSPLRRGGRKK